MYGPTDGLTDGQTDGQTDQLTEIWVDKLTDFSSYRYERTHLKTKASSARKVYFVQYQSSAFKEYS